MVEKPAENLESDLIDDFTETMRRATKVIEGYKETLTDLIWRVEALREQVRALGKEPVA